MHPYLDPAERDGRLEAAADRLGAEIVTYGTSVEGRPLRAVRLPASSSSAPRVLCTANLHGPELISSHLALALLDRLAEGVDGGLRRRAELWVAPCLNPDGYARTWRQQGRGSLAELRTNAHGVDLNRNFPLPGRERPPSHIPWAGSSRAGSSTYRGPAPLSEPESAALDSLLRARRFHASVNLHSFMGVVIPPRVRDRGSYERYRSLCRRFRLAQPRTRYPRLASRWLDFFTGELEDYQHHTLGCWTICVETMSLPASLRQHLVAPSVFWRFNPRDPGPWIENDLPGVLAFVDAALDLPAPTDTVGERL